MKAKLMELQKLMERELDAFQSLNDIALKQQQAIVNDDLDLLLASTEQLQLLAFENAVAERRRVELMRELAADLSLDDGEPVTLNALLATLGDDGNLPRLAELGVQLKQTVSHLQRVNETNILLLRYSVQFIGELFRSVVQEPPQEKTAVYSITGKHPRRKAERRALVNLQG